MTKLNENNKRIVYEKIQKEFWLETQQYKPVFKITFPVYLFLGFSLVFFLYSAFGSVVIANFGSGDLPIK